jgi:hypothetical protein
MRNRRLNQFATWLLRSSLELAPAQVRPWGDGMLAELRFVEGSWASFSWAMGGTGLLLKHALVSFFAGPAGGSAARDPIPGFDKEGSMKKLAAWVAGLSVAMSLLLFLSPVFRQALGVVEASWRLEFLRPLVSERERKSLADQARAEHDARTLAFLALQWVPNEERSRLADEAVKMDPSLTWIYSPLADHTRTNPEAARWVEQLNQWDRDNAVPKLVIADRIYNESFLRVPFGQLEASLAANPQWREAMAAAFHSPRYDSYFGNLFDLDRDVMPRRGVNEPMTMMAALAVFGFPNLYNLQVYEKLLFAEGAKLEATGDVKGASESYWGVVRFAQVMMAGAPDDFERLTAAHMLAEGSARLEPIVRKQGSTNESAVLGYQVTEWNVAQERRREESFWWDAYQWNARIVGDASLALGLAFLLTLGSGIFLGIGHLRGRSTPDRYLRIAQALGVAGAAGVLVSSLAMYLNYQPYAELYRHFLAQHGGSDLRSLRPFFSFWGSSNDLIRYFDSGLLAVFFWYVFIAAGLIALALMIKRLLQHSLKAHPAS